jgi:Arc/MetJ-type ribon-helix-helix transcriptional regulator
MRSLTVRLPEELVAEIESESRRAGLSKSDIVRSRLQAALPDRVAAGAGPTLYDLAGDLLGVVGEDDLPADLARRKKHHLRKLGYGEKRHR